MAIAIKRTRILAAVVLLVIVYAVFSNSSRRDIAALTSLTNPGAVSPVSLSEAYDPDPDLNPPTPKLLKDAHELATADDFLSHFKAVTQLPGITLEEAKLTCLWTDTDHVNFQFGEDQGNWVEKDREDDEIAARREDWQRFVTQQMLPWASFQSGFRGRGIVVPAGNEKSMQRLSVLLKALTKLGTKLPVEIHHFPGEIGDAERAELSRLWPKIYFNDLSADTNIAKASPGGFVNFHLKPAAVLNSRFEELLLLESDNIPVMDPTLLFESDMYQEYGTLFWPDMSRTRPQNPVWSISNTRCRMDEYTQESGQVMVDKRRYFYHLQLANWLHEEHSDYYNEFLLGDKDMFRFAWHMLKTQFGAPKKWLTSVGTENDGFYCGHSFAQHHPNGSIAFLHGGLLKSMDLAVMRWNRETKGGIFRSYKRSKHDERPDVIESVGVKGDSGEYMPQDKKPKEVAQCMDMDDVQARDLEELLPGIEVFFSDIGGYWRLENA